MTHLRPIATMQAQLRSGAVLRAVACFVFTFLITLPVFSQGTTATLGGTVTDPTGAVIPKAEITLKN